MARIVIATFGSYGDVFPYLAIARRLHERGHEVVFAAAEIYRSAAEETGARFAPTRPEVNYEDTETIRRVMDRRRGPEVIVKEIMVPALRDMYADLEGACEGADVLVSHVLTYAAPILAEKRNLPWLSTLLSPLVFASAYDPPALAPIPWLARLRPLGPGVVGLLWRLLKRISWSWSEPIRAFRTELGLAADRDPLWDGQFSPHGTLALFSSVFAQPQPDWPASTAVCGFPFHDRDFGGGGDAKRLASFLESGAPPLVFSLGSSAVHAAGDFYTQAAEAAHALGERAVLVTGIAPAPRQLPEGVLAIGSAAVHELYAAARLVTHAGGVGTVGQILRAGRPQLVVPMAHDHFDNGLRVERMGAGRSFRKRLTAARLTGVLREMLADATLDDTVASLAEAVRSEDGAGAACAAIESRVA